jgi:hypothetical protein
LSGQWDAGVFSVSVTKAGFPAASTSFAVTRGADPNSPPIALRVGLKGARLLRTLRRCDFLKVRCCAVLCGAVPLTPPTPHPPHAGMRPLTRTLAQVQSVSLPFTSPLTLLLPAFSTSLAGAVDVPAEALAEATPMGAGAGAADGAAVPEGSGCPIARFARWLKR